MKKIGLAIGFALSVFGNAIVILFRRHKDIELIRLDYAGDHIFESSFQPVSYRFRNALWYRFDGRDTLEKELKIFNLPNAPSEFGLTVFGLFRKKEYRIALKPNTRLESNFFATHISTFDVALTPVGTFELPPAVWPSLPNIALTESDLALALPDFSIEFNPFNQND